LLLRCGFLSQHFIKMNLLFRITLLTCSGLQHSARMILFTFFTATISFIVFGLLLPDYAVLCFFVCLVAMAVGQIVMAVLMKRAGGRSSYIALSIRGVVLVSAILMTIQSLLSMVEAEQHHPGGICGKRD